MKTIFDVYKKKKLEIGSKIEWTNPMDFENYFGKITAINTPENTVTIETFEDGDLYTHILKPNSDGGFPLTIDDEH